MQDVTIEKLCEMIREVFEKGSEDLKTTATITIQAWVGMIDRSDKPEVHH